jgi:hypothetical protein
MPLPISPNGAFLVSLAEQHASALGYLFDEAGRIEFGKISDQALETARQSEIITVEDVMRDVAPNTIALTNSIVPFAEGTLLTATAVRRGLLAICPLFPFC